MKFTAVFILLMIIFAAVYSAPYNFDDDNDDNDDDQQERSLIPEDDFDMMELRADGSFLSWFDSESQLYCSWWPSE